MFKKSRTAVFGILIFAVLLVLCIQKWTNGTKNIAGILLLPFSSTVSWLGDSTGVIGDWLTAKKILLQEQEQMEIQLKKDQLALIRLRELEAENIRLRQALDFRQRSPWKIKFAKVIGRDPSNWWKAIIINVGSESGIKQNQPVLATFGEAALVGRVFQVGKWESRVVLVGDPNCLVSVVIGETRNSGILQPLVATGWDNTIVKLSYLSGNQNLVPGQRVYTSGMGGMFPGGIYVGNIEDSVNLEYGLYKEASVRLAADPNLLEEVWVITQ